MKFNIPKLNQEELEQRYANIKPLVKDGSGDLCYIKRPESLTGVSFLWDPKLKDKAKDIEPITTIKTLHTYGHYALFKPSIAEVLAQIPKHLLDTACAFHLQGPGGASDLNMYKDELNAGFQVAFATLYKSTRVVERPKKSKLRKLWDGLIG